MLDAKILGCFNPGCCCGVSRAPQLEVRGLWGGTEEGAADALELTPGHGWLSLEAFFLSL